jgi:ABC-2 type transport system permease protein
VSVGGLALLALVLWAGIGAGVYMTTLEETVPPPTYRIPLINLEVPITDEPPVVEQVPMRQRVDVRAFSASVLHLFAFGFFLLGLSSMFSALDRYRWRTIGAVVAVYVVQLVMYGLGKAAESLSWLQSLTFFSCYRPQKMTSLANDYSLWAPWSLTEAFPGGRFPPLAYPLILLALGVIAYAIAVVRFARRDLPAPL